MRIPWLQKFILLITHTKSPLIQVDDSYPFCFTFNTYSRENSVAYRWKFQSQEHIDDLGLNWDTFKLRNHQPDIGRFFNIDPLSDKYVDNSPYAFSENHVIAHVELEGLEKASAIFGVDKKVKLKEASLQFSDKTPTLTFDKEKGEIGVKQEGDIPGSNHKFEVAAEHNTEEGGTKVTIKTDVGKDAPSKVAFDQKGMEKNIAKNKVIADNKLVNMAPKKEVDTNLKKQQILKVDAETAKAKSEFQKKERSQGPKQE